MAKLAERVDKLLKEYKMSEEEFRHTAFHKMQPIDFYCMLKGEKFCCEICEIVGTQRNRTFTTDKDMMYVFRKLVDSGEWEKFAMKTKDDIRSFDQHWYMETVISWLFYKPERFNKLVAQAIREGVIKI